MRLIELFSKDATAVGVKAKNKAEVIDVLVDLQATHGNITDKAAYTQAIFDREEEFSTYVGNGIVVPHAKTGVVTAPSLAVVRLADRIQYNPDDDEKSVLHDRRAHEWQSACGYAGPPHESACQRGLCRQTPDSEK